MTEFSKGWKHGWETRDGRAVKIYDPEANGGTEIHGAIFNTTSWSPASWHSCGQMLSRGQHNSDLVNKPLRMKTVTRYGWMQIGNKVGGKIKYMLAPTPSAVTYDTSQKRDERTMYKNEMWTPCTITYEVPE